MLKSNSVIRAEKAGLRLGLETSHDVERAPNGRLLFLLLTCTACKLKHPMHSPALPLLTYTTQKKARCYELCKRSSWKPKDKLPFIRKHDFHTCLTAFQLSKQWISALGTFDCDSSVSGFLLLLSFSFSPLSHLRVLLSFLWPLGGFPCCSHSPTCPASFISSRTNHPKLTCALPTLGSELGIAVKWGLAKRLPLSMSSHFF